MIDFNFIENELNNLSPEIEKTVFAMHVKPFEFVFNNRREVYIRKCTFHPVSYTHLFFHYFWAFIMINFKNNNIEKHETRRRKKMCIRDRP